MSVRDRVIEVMEAGRSRYISGQELAEILGVTRAAVWKAVESLREEGYHITAVPKLGYRLEDNSDVLSEAGIRMYCSGRYRSIPIHIFKCVDSTNTCAKRMILDGAVHGTLVAAEEQTCGRGRYGKPFFSPAGTGVYMSLILKPERRIQEVLPITITSAVAAARVIERFSGGSASIKWVNDIYRNGRKVCGILTEAITDFESGMAEAVVVGIGINVTTGMDVFPETLRQTAGSILPSGGTRNQMIGQLVSEILCLSEDLSSPEILREYRQKSCVIGKEISWQEDESLRTGTAVEIDAQGCLVVQAEGGQRLVLHPGERSVKIKQT